MKDKWYGDNRDLVKWGVLVKVAQQSGAKRILQVAYHRPSDWQTIEIDGHQHQVPECVIRHFRDIRDVVRLTDGSTHKMQIEVLDDPFENRQAYLEEILARVRALRSRAIIFLDPDTGLECRKPGFEHVLESELKRIWAAMRSGDVLVFYQHQTNRNGSPWVDLKRAQFERALDIPTGSAKTAVGKAARDVAFFLVQKNP